MTILNDDSLASWYPHKFNQWDSLGSVPKWVMSVTVPLTQSSPIATYLVLFHDQPSHLSPVFQFMIDRFIIPTTLHILKPFFLLSTSVNRDFRPCFRLVWICGEHPNIHQPASHRFFKLCACLVSILNTNLWTLAMLKGKRSYAWHLITEDSISRFQWLSIHEPLWQQATIHHSNRLNMTIRC